jgi:hypothetical protein
VPVVPLRQAIPSVPPREIVMKQVFPKSVMTAAAGAGKWVGNRVNSFSLADRRSIQ